MIHDISSSSKLIMTQVVCFLTQFCIFYKLKKKYLQNKIEAKTYMSQS